MWMKARGLYHIALACRVRVALDEIRPERCSIENCLPCVAESLNFYSGAEALPHISAYATPAMNIDDFHPLYLIIRLYRYPHHSHERLIQKGLSNAAALGLYIIHPWPVYARLLQSRSGGRLHIAFERL